MVGPGFGFGASPAAFSVDFRWKKTGLSISIMLILLSLVSVPSLIKDASEISWVTVLAEPLQPAAIAGISRRVADAGGNIERIHFFPLGGIKTNATWAIENGGDAATPANG